MPSPAGEKPNSVVITAPLSGDVLCGRGGGTNYHIGNSYWRQLVGANKRLYLTLPKRHKALVAKSIVHAIRSRDPPGRFLEKEKDGMWYDIGDRRAREKTSQALREGAPSIRSEMRVEKLKDFNPSPGIRPGQILPDGLIALDYTDVEQIDGHSSAVYCKIDGFLSDAIKKRKKSGCDATATTPSCTVSAAAMPPDFSNMSMMQAFQQFQAGHFNPTMMSYPQHEPSASNRAKIPVSLLPISHYPTKKSQSQQDMQSSMVVTTPKIDGVTNIPLPAANSRSVQSQPKSSAASEDHKVKSYEQKTPSLLNQNLQHIHHIPQDVSLQKPHDQPRAEQNQYSSSPSMKHFHHGVQPDELNSSTQIHIQSNNPFLARELALREKIIISRQNEILSGLQGHALEQNHLNSSVQPAASVDQSLPSTQIHIPPSRANNIVTREQMLIPSQNEVIEDTQRQHLQYIHALQRQRQALFERRAVLGLNNVYTGLGLDVPQVNYISMMNQSNLNGLGGIPLDRGLIDFDSQHLALLQRQYNAQLLGGGLFTGLERISELQGNDHLSSRDGSISQPDLEQQDILYPSNVNRLTSLPTSIRSSSISLGNEELQLLRGLSSLSQRQDSSLHLRGFSSLSQSELLQLRQACLLAAGDSSEIVSEHSRTAHLMHMAELWNRQRIRLAEVANEPANEALEMVRQRRDVSSESCERQSSLDDLARAAEIAGRKLQRTGSTSSLSDENMTLRESCTLSEREKDAKMKRSIWKKMKKASQKVSNLPLGRTTRSLIVGNSDSESSWAQSTTNTATPNSGSTQKNNTNFETENTHEDSTECPVVRDAPKKRKSQTEKTVQVSTECQAVKILSKKRKLVTTQSSKNPSALSHRFKNKQENSSVNSKMKKNTKKNHSKSDILSTMLNPTNPQNPKAEALWSRRKTSSLSDGQFDDPEDEV